MKEQLIHILDQSVCLSRKQMKEYISGAMQHEEMHAAEIHLSSCPLCSMAMEGFEEHSDEALAAIASLNSGFLKEHFDNIAPQIHLNSMAPAATLPAAHRKSGHQAQPVWRTASIAAGILLLFGALWYIEFGPASHSGSKQLAMSEAAPEPLSSDESNRMTGATQPAGTASNQQQDLSATGASSDGNKPEHTTSDEAYAANVNTAADSAPLEAIGAQPAKAALMTKTPALSDASAPSGKPESLEVKQLAPNGVAEKKDLFAPAEDLAIASTRTYTTASPAPREVDMVSTEALKKKETAKVAERSASTPMELGKEAFDKGKYGAALTQYKKQMESGTPQERNQARIMAARCYAALGNKARAQQLLQAVIDEGSGPERRAARRTLRELQ